MVPPLVAKWLKEALSLRRFPLFTHEVFLPGTWRIPFPREKRKAYPIDGPGCSIYEEPSVALERRQQLRKEKVEQAMLKKLSTFPASAVGFFPTRRKPLAHLARRHV